MARLSFNIPEWSFHQKSNHPKDLLLSNLVSLPCLGTKSSLASSIQMFLGHCFCNTFDGKYARITLNIFITAQFQHIKVQPEPV